MKKIKVVTLLLTATLTVSALAAYGYGKMISPGKTVVSADASFAYHDKNELVNLATVIVSGEVVSSEVQDDLRGFPATDYIVKVDKVFRGNPGAEVEVRTEGGENAKMIYDPGEGYVTFQIGEQVVLFLTDDKGDRTDKDDFGYYVLGVQGKFKEENGKLTNRDYTFDAATFAQELDQIEKENKANGLKKLTDVPSSDGI
ncbi:MAG: hypothetical protein KGZ93_04390 [Actinobacteria bacterium]|nr:hypothetical protein [Actinomycetota bacterium]